MGDEPEEVDVKPVSPKEHPALGPVRATEHETTEETIRRLKGD